MSGFPYDRDTPTEGLLAPRVFNVNIERCRLRLPKAQWPLLDALLEERSALIDVAEAARELAEKYYAEAGEATNEVHELIDALDHRLSALARRFGGREQP